jgi:hypothetical protein
MPAVACVLPFTAMPQSTLRRLRLFLSIPFLVVTVGTGLYAAERPLTHLPVAEVWTLDRVESIGGHTPEVLGAPKVVDAEFPPFGPALEFDGRGDALVVPINPLANWSTFTIEVLFMPTASSPPAQRFVHIEDDRECRVMLETRSADGMSWSLDTFLQGATDNCTLRDTRKVHPTDTWTWVALVYDGKKMASYINRMKELEGEVTFAPMTSGRIALGVRLNRAYWFKGRIKEVRFHPTAIEPAKLQRVEQK